MKKKIHHGLLMKVLINKFKRAFIKNPLDKNFEELMIPILTELNKLKDSKTLSACTFTIKSIFDLGNFHFTYKHILLPEIENQSKRMRNYMKKSFYYKQFKISKSFYDDKYEIIRIGYVHLYHKYESFRNDIVKIIDECLSNSFNSKIEISKYLFEEYKYSIDDLKTQPLRLKKINWICNCVKHKDGYPLKANPPKQFENSIQTEKIKIDIDEFESDIFFLLDYFVKSYSSYIKIGLSQYAFGLLQKKKIKENVIFEKVKEDETSLKTNTLIALLQLMNIEEHFANKI